jgi:CRP-like cAMP-binding protein
MSDASRNLPTNRILASLPPEDCAQLASVSRIEHPAQGRILIRSSESGTDIWFPLQGAIALTTTDASGRAVQTGMVGREGCVGLQALFGLGIPSPDAVVQIEGAMSVISANHLRAAMDVRPPIQVALTKFLYGLSAESLQTIACNRLHSMLSRCCRWLLTMQDKAKSDDLRMTQEDLATLLGGGRPRVNVILAALKKNGILRRYRGRIHLLTRAGLEQHSCECYRRVRDASELLDIAPSRNPTVTPVTDS